MVHPHYSQDGNKKMVRAEMQRRIEINAKKLNGPGTSAQKSGGQAKGTGATSKVVLELSINKNSAAYRLLHNDEIMENVLRCCSSDRRAMYLAQSSMSCTHSAQSIKSLSTKKDLQSLEDGTAKSTGFVDLFELPSTKDVATSVITKRYLQQRGAYPSKVVHKTAEETTGIFGVAMLQTCQRVHKLGCEILYGANKFVVDTRGAHATSRPLSSSAAQKSVDSMFDMNQHHRGFIHEDPLASFFRRIGPKNTAFITRMRIEGSIHDTPFHGGSAQTTHPTRPLNDSGKDRLGVLAKAKENRMDAVIGDLVKSLVTLKEAELNGPTYRIEYEDETQETGGMPIPKIADPTRPWGDALRWNGVIAARGDQYGKVLRVEKINGRQTADRAKTSFRTGNKWRSAYGKKGGEFS
ncbi:hypothetical protein DL95DRAFT_468959 [Leptodontidium sp. 2 PMI_412]|nr:hypothetical protein DL95DRAFT_468959 [Leptodontidium sp. 2 PMI_412]